ncbi:MAG: hypothetical protein K9K38_19650 [Rhodoferax sp.]|nr:hypothetical protein [Rhodoferax sp.]MCF8211592.1 hypothetical protein [Rhodoferax sp.]
MATENPESKRKGGGGKLARSVIVTVRMDPQLNYLADLAARKHRRTLSSFIEWAVQQSFSDVELYQDTGFQGDNSISLKEMEQKLWDVDDSERFVRLAIHCPELLTHEEQERWKLLSDSQLLSPAMTRSNGERVWNWAKLEDVVFPVLRRAWNSLLVAHEAGPEASRKWVSATQANIGTIYKGPAPAPAPASTSAVTAPKPVSVPAKPVASVPAKPAASVPAKPVASPTFDDMDDDIPF